MNFVTILQGTQLLGVITNVTLDLALKIKALFQHVGNDITVNIHTADATAVTANNDTIALVNAWLASKGLPAVPAQPAELPAPDPAPVAG